MDKQPVVIKRDTEENWNKAKNYKPPFGTIILYESSTGVSKLKIGDGETLVNDLPDLIKPSAKVSEDGILNL